MRKRVRGESQHLCQLVAELGIHSISIERAQNARTTAAVERSSLARSKTRRGTGAWAQTSRGGGKGKREGAGLGREDKEIVGAGGRGSGGCAKRSEWRGSQWKGEREGRGWSVGPRPRKRKGEARGGLGLTGREQGEEGNSLFFFKQIFKCIYNLNFEQIFFYRNSHITK